MLHLAEQVLIGFGILAVSVVFIFTTLFDIYYGLPVPLRLSPLPKNRLIRLYLFLSVLAWIPGISYLFGLTVLS